MSEILIVDNKSSIEEISELVKSSQYGYLQIYTATNARRTLTLLKQYPPDALIIDVSLPDMDGIELGKTPLQIYPHLPTIIVTQLKMFELAPASINAGFAAYLLKPIL